MKSVDRGVTLADLCSYICPDLMSAYQPGKWKGLNWKYELGVKGGLGLRRPSLEKVNSFSKKEGQLLFIKY